MARTQITQNGLRIVTPKGSVIERYPKTGVGKFIRGKLYFRIASEYLSMVTKAFPGFKKAFIKTSDAAWQAMVIKKTVPLVKFSCICFDTRTGVVRLDEAPDFDTAREPHVGRWAKMDGDRLVMGKSNAIWHHKWLWVEGHYPGFRIAPAQEWSLTYVPLIAGTPAGTDKSWQAQLKVAGLQ